MLKKEYSSYLQSSLENNMTYLSVCTHRYDKNLENFPTGMN